MEKLPGPMKVNEMRIDLIAYLHESGWSVADIGEIFNLNTSTIFRIIKRIANTIKKHGKRKR